MFACKSLCVKPRGVTCPLPKNQDQGGNGPPRTIQQSETALLPNSPRHITVLTLAGSTNHAGGRQAGTGRWSHSAGKSTVYRDATPFGSTCSLTPAPPCSVMPAIFVRCWRFTSPSETCQQRISTPPPIPLPPTAKHTVTPKTQHMSLSSTPRTIAATGEPTHERARGGAARCGVMRWHSMDGLIPSDSSRIASSVGQSVGRHIQSTHPRRRRGGSQGRQGKVRWVLRR